MLELVDCGNVAVRGLRLENAPAYSIRFYRCDGVRAEDVTVRNDPRSPNTDGIQIRDTRNALIRGADINTGDDAIVVKSYDRMVENLVVTDSILVSDDAAIKFGTAGHVGVRNSLFSNIVIRDSRYGIALFQMDGGSYLNNSFRNISIETGGRARDFFAVYADIDRRRADGPLGRIEGLWFSDLTVATTGTVLMGGQPGAPIRDLRIDGLTIRVPTGAVPIGPTRRKPRGNAFVPPTGQTQDHATVAATLVIANAEGVRVDGLDIGHADAATDRSALALIGVSNAAINGLGFASAGTTSQPVIQLDRTRAVAIGDVSPPHGAQRFLAVGPGGHQGRLSLRSADLGALTLANQLPEGVRLETSGVIAPTVPGPAPRPRQR
jgi:hypothetical protein